VIIDARWQRVIVRRDIIIVRRLVATTAATGTFARIDPRAIRPAPASMEFCWGTTPGASCQHDPPPGHLGGDLGGEVGGEPYGFFGQLRKRCCDPVTVQRGAIGVSADSTRYRLKLVLKTSPRTASDALMMGPAWRLSMESVTTTTSCPCP